MSFLNLRFLCLIKINNLNKNPSSPPSNEVLLGDENVYMSVCTSDDDEKLETFKDPLNGIFTKF